MIIFNALVRALETKGVITKEDSVQITDFYKLASIIEGRMKELLNPLEVAYVNTVEELLKEERFEAIQGLAPPKSMENVHRTIIKVIPILKSGGAQ